MTRTRTIVAALFATLTLAGCANVGTSQSIIARPLLNETTVGGPGYPIAIFGAESVGLAPRDIASNMRFPARLMASSSFRAIDDANAPPTHAHLEIAPNGERADSTLTFLHGDRRIGVGTFSLPRAAYADPQALGGTTAVLIDRMLREARARTRGRGRWDF